MAFHHHQALPMVPQKLVMVLEGGIQMATKDQVQVTFLRETEMVMAMENLVLHMELLVVDKLELVLVMETEMEDQALLMEHLV